MDLKKANKGISANAAKERVERGMKALCCITPKRYFQKKLKVV
jgi:hypothetical protein